MFSRFVTLVFKSPNLLWLFALIAIPIIIHLFNLRRTKRIVFSNTVLLQQVKEESYAKRKPKELLILISRILVFSFLVLAFAQPTIKNNEVITTGDVLIYLDNSPSHMVQIEEGTLIDRGIMMAESIIEAYPEETKFRFIENSYSNSIQTLYTRETLTDLLTETKIVNIGRNEDEIEKRISRAFTQGDVYWISDFNNMRDLSGVDTTLMLKLIPLSSENRSNIFVDTVFLENSFLSGNFTNSLNIQLNSSGIRNTNSTVRVFINEKLTGTLNIQIQDNVGQGSFEIPSGTEALDNIRLLLDDANTTFDNEFNLSINSLKLTNVLEVFNASSSSYVSQLFDDNEYFNFSRTSSQQIDVESFKNADFILINGIEAFSNQLINEIQSSISKGATLVFIPNDTFSASDLLKFGIRMVSGSEEKILLNAPNFDDPFYEGVFEEEEPNLQMPFGSTDFRLLNSEYTLIQFLNGRPFLSKVATTGNVFVFASPFEPNRTNFMNHSLFVPVFYRMALGSQRSFANLYYYTDSENISFPVASSSSQVYSLTSNFNQITPDQREQNGNLVLFIPKDEIQSGIYNLIQDGETYGKLAFNLPKSESLINENKEELLLEISQHDHISISKVTDASQLSSQLRANLLGKTYWKLSLLLGLLFLFVEIILIRY